MRIEVGQTDIHIGNMGRYMYLYLEIQHLLHLRKLRKCSTTHVTICGQH